jgi:hypothetical protein
MCEFFRGRLTGGHIICERFERDRVIADRTIGALPRSRKRKRGVCGARVK